MLDDLAAVIGEQAALALGWAYRGERLYIPKNPDTEPGIAEAIGAAAAQHLCTVFGGTVVPVPLGVLITRRVRELAAQGLKKKEIARACCISEPRVYAVLKAARQAESNRAQLRLL